MYTHAERAQLDTSRSMNKYANIENFADKTKKKDNNGIHAHYYAVIQFDIKGVCAVLLLSNVAKYLI